MANLQIGRDVFIENYGLNGGYGNHVNGFRTPDGTLHLIYGWTSADYTQTVVRHSKSTDNGATWSSPVSITRGTSNTSPAIAVDSNSNVHAVWQTNDSYTNQMEYRKYNASTSTWLTSVMLTTNNTYPQSGYPTIAVDSIDNIHVAWTGRVSGSSSYTILRYVKCTGGSWGTIDDVSTPLNMNSVGPVIDTDSSNNPHVICWHQFGSSPINYYCRLFSKAASWSSYDVATGTTYPIGTGVTLWVGANDEKYVAWRGRSASYSAVDNVYFRRTINQSWQSTVAVTTETNSSYAQSIPNIIQNLSGDLWLVWSGKTTTSNAKYILRCSKFSGGSWGSILDITPSTTDNAYGTLIGVPHTGLCLCFYWSTARTFRYIASSDLSWTAPVGGSKLPQVVFMSPTTTGF